MTMEEYMAECKALCEAMGYDWEAMESEFCMASAMIDGLTPTAAVATLHSWLD